MSKLSSLEKSVTEIRALLLAQGRAGQDNTLDGLDVFLPQGRRLETMEELVEFEKMLQVEERKRRLVRKGNGGSVQRAAILCVYEMCTTALP